MKRYATGIPVLVFAVAVLLISSGGFAYDEYDSNPIGCDTCHPDFNGPGDALHDGHTAFISNTCDMCHPSNPGSKPVSTFSAGDATAISCLGCHGRDYGGSVGTQSAGLRVFHVGQGFSCSPCHDSDPVPAGENVNPPHYGRSDVSLATACADNLDNDGDGLKDGADPDCQVPVETSTWGKVKALYAD
jgi:hypothetical protein